MCSTKKQVQYFIQGCAWNTFQELSFLLGGMRNETFIFIMGNEELVKFMKGWVKGMVKEKGEKQG